MFGCRMSAASHASHLLVPCLLLALLPFVLLVPQRTYSSGRWVVSEFSSNKSMYHLVVDDILEKVYIGGADSVFQLDVNLKLEVQAKSGPDSSNQTNHNKVLLVFEQYLITCGTGYHGTCQTRELLNISNVKLYADEIGRRVSATEKGLTTVAFIASAGPFRDRTGTEVLKEQNALYVGMSYTGTSELPSVCTRTLLDDKSKFQILMSDKQELLDFKWPFVKINPGFTGGPPIIFFKTGFSHEGFAYFLTVQPKRIGNSYQNVSRLIRICQHDSQYLSYIEVDLKCVSASGDTFDQVQDAQLLKAGSYLSGRIQKTKTRKDEFILLAVFTNGYTDSRARSALCVYPMVEIQSKIMENIILCYKGEPGNFKPNHLELGSSRFDGEKCVEIEEWKKINESFCGSATANRHGLNFPLQGTRPIESQAASTFPGRLSAVTGTTINNVTVAIIGHHDGAISKLTVDDIDESYVYQKISVVPGSEILPDLILDKNGTHIYTLTNQTVAKLRTWACDEYDTCDQCLGSRDPYCGWCALENKCSLRHECERSDRPLHWLWYGTDNCIRITDVAPDRTPVQEQTLVGVNITNLPDIPNTEEYFCVFGNHFSIAMRNDFGITCDSPPITQLPDFESDNLHIKLKVRYGRLGKDFLSTDFYFFRCERLMTCGACVSSRWSCDWCIYDNMCNHNSSACQGNTYVIAGINNPDAFMNQGSEECPSVHSGGTEILLPHGVRKSIILRGKHLPPSEVRRSTYQCVLQTAPDNPRSWIYVPAERTSNNAVTCLEYSYRYDEPLSLIRYKLTVEWDRGSFLESNVTVTLYKCGNMGRDCSQCLSRDFTDERYECTWCNDKCEYRSVCVGASAPSCPKPVINRFYPLTGPIEGGTNLTIEGSNLGKSFEDISKGGKILVLGRTCTPLKQQYEISTKIVCVIGPKNKDVISDQSVVVVRLASQLVGKSRYAFQFQDPKIVSVHPMKAPKSGGSKVTIQGSSLNTGNEVKVFIGNYPCLFEKHNKKNTSVVCTTQKVEKSQVIKMISMTFDGVYRNLSQTFIYTEDPTITGLKPLKSFAAGGRYITVTGTNLTAIQHPKMFLISSDWRSNETLCRVVSDMVMKCPSPRIPEWMMKSPVPPTPPPTSYIRRPYQRNTLNNHQRKYPDQVSVSRMKRRSEKIRKDDYTVIQPTSLTFRIGFIMDGVTAVQDTGKNFPNISAELTYVPNPVCCTFPEKVEVYDYIGERLVLKGEKLREAVDEKDIVVYIGKEVCNVTSLVQSELSCIPPERQPKGLGLDDLPLVTVRMGNLEISVGYVRYKVYSKSDFPIFGIYGIIAAAGLLMIIIVVILVVCKQRSSVKAKRFRIALDEWERKVRDECKQAFAELQTDMTDLTSDLNLTGIPYWDYRTYVFKVLFPSLKDHPVLTVKETLSSHRSHSDSAMMSFNQLVINKPFLITFIRTLEQQRSFSVRDKSNVAALLMVIMQDKMEYATEVVKELLLDLIEKSLERKTPKLMFRRTESVIEKMVSNWLSLCLYQNLLDCVGKPMFMLFKAVKQQVEKGPVDAITAEARYSLSEDKLLREKVEPQTITLIVHLDDETVQCKVLDCDSITQVKEKLLDAVYKNQPFSKRESVHDLDLEWLGGRTGSLCLQDDDITCVVDANGWKKINNLGHYKVPDMSVVRLLPRQHDSLTRPPFDPAFYNVMHSMTSVAPMAQDPESGKHYHLVRPQEDPSHERGHKVISELLLPRLLATKGTLQQFVDDLFKAILTVDDELPIAIKYIFDFLDDAARKYHIDDPETVTLWKSNLLPLRFWVNIIKNPNFVFDIHKPHIVDSCLSVIAQTFMDSCSTSEHRLGKDSPTNKLLYAKDIPNYRELVSKYYEDIRNLPIVSDQEMNIYLVELSRNHPTDFNVTVALTELYEYVNKYYDEVMEALQENPYLAKETMKLEQIKNCFDIEMTAV